MTNDDIVYIYGFRCPGESKIMYIGQTYDVKLRFRQHKRDALRGKNTAICQWIRDLLADGKEPEIVVLEEVPWQGRANLKEIAWINSARAINPELKNSPWTGSKTKITLETVDSEIARRNCRRG